MICLPQDCACAPQDSAAFAVGLITGRVLACRTQESLSSLPQLSFSLKAHQDSCRSVSFTADGRLLLTASADKSVLVVDFASGKPVARLREAHDAALSRVTGLSPWTFCSAADSGQIRLWDARQQAAVCTEQAHTDFVTDMSFEGRRQCLLSVSGDGTLCVYDLRANKVRQREQLVEL